MKYLAKKKVEIITENTVLPAEDFGAWQALNTGTTIATVDGVPLDPNGSVVALDFSHLHPSVVWGDPIRIDFTGSGTNAVVLTRIRYSEISEA